MRQRCPPPTTRLAQQSWPESFHPEPSISAHKIAAGRRAARETECMCSTALERSNPVIEPNVWALPANLPRLTAPTNLRESSVVGTPGQRRHQCKLTGACVAPGANAAACDALARRKNSRCRFTRFRRPGPHELDANWHSVALRTSGSNTPHRATPLNGSPAMRFSEGPG
jgi:hypothetical protein